MRNLFSPAKAAVLGNKRGFLDVMNGFQKGNFLSNSEVNTILSSRPSSNLGLKPASLLESLGVQQAKMKEVSTTKVGVEKPHHAFNESRPSLNGSANNNSSAPATKAGRKRWTTGVRSTVCQGQLGGCSLFKESGLEELLYIPGTMFRGFTISKEEFV
ncbi:hypothetical protein S83_048058 [Arachis hypogaea]